MKPYEFYTFLLEFLNKKGHSPQLVRKMQEIYTQDDCTLCFSESLLKEYTSAYFGADIKFKQNLRTKFCEAAFRDLASSLDDPDTRKLFEKFQKISNTTNHLFIIIFQPESENPLYRGIWSNSPILLENLLTENKSLQEIHVFRE